jgi:hypothetical protein
MTPVYCVCELPYNPDRPMILCEQCGEWFHVECVKESWQEKNMVGVCPSSECKSRWGAAEVQEIMGSNLQ